MLDEGTNSVVVRMGGSGVEELSAVVKFGSIGKVDFNDVVVKTGGGLVKRSVVKILGVLELMEDGIEIEEVGSLDVEDSV